MPYDGGFNKLLGGEQFETEDWIYQARLYSGKIKPRKNWRFGWDLNGDGEVDYFEYFSIVDFEPFNDDNNLFPNYWVWRIYIDHPTQYAYPADAALIWLNPIGPPFNPITGASSAGPGDRPEEIY